MKEKLLKLVESHFTKVVSNETNELDSLYNAKYTPVFDSNVSNLIDMIKQSDDSIDDMITKMIISSKNMLVKLISDRELISDSNVEQLAEVNARIDYNELVISLTDLMKE